MEIPGRDTGQVSELVTKHTGRKNGKGDQGRRAAKRHQRNFASSEKEEEATTLRNIETTKVWESRSKLYREVL